MSFLGKGVHQQLRWLLLWQVVFFQRLQMHPFCPFGFYVHVPVRVRGSTSTSTAHSKASLYRWCSSTGITRSHVDIVAYRMVGMLQVEALGRQESC